MANDIQPKQPPTLGIPKGTNTCQISIINTTCDITTVPNVLIQPDIKGYEWMNLPTYAFYVKDESTGRQVLFDLGCRKDWENLVPRIVEMINKSVNGLKVDKDVVDILPEGNVNIHQVEALILSHWHYDHSGAPSTLPPSTKIIVGPGFRNAFMPGYPARQDSPFHEADFEGREVIETPFSDSFKIGRFQAYDYFGNGSLYVLNVPGHTTGHISALVRTTPDTFVFLGGDSCHFTGVIRPTEYIPLPENIPEDAVLDRRIARPCPCSIFTNQHPDQANSRTSPFFTVSDGYPVTFYEDPPTARESIKGLIEFDADPNVLMAIAHDPTSLEVFDFFPKGTLNDWKRKGWKRASHWGFLSELPYEGGKPVREVLVDGLYKGSEKLRGLEC